MGLGLTAQSDRELTLGNSFEAPSFATVDAQLAYQLDNYTLRLNVQNVFDNDFFEPHQFLLQPVVRPSQPLSAFVTLSARF